MDAECPARGIPMIIGVPRAFLMAASLGMALAAASACDSASSGWISDDGSTSDVMRPIPIEYPIILRGRAPGFEREATVERIADSADLSTILRTYRLDQENTRRFVDDLATTVQWWLVVPPGQRTGGYRLRVTLDEQTADACLVPPQGAVTMALATTAYLVGLPRNVGMLNWHAKCP